MLHRVTKFFVAAAFVCLTATAGVADVTPYAQNFNNLNMADPAALTNNGWLVFGNVFDGGGGFKFGYGVFGAPNGGPAFSAIVAGEGGPTQGSQQLSVYNDYNCCDPGGTNQGHFNGTDIVESLVFQEQTVGAGDVGQTYEFRFDAKAGNIDPNGANVSAFAFIKTLDPNAGFQTTEFITLDMTNLPVTWGTYKIAITIDNEEGHLIQFGFGSTASDFAATGIVYDNVGFAEKPISVEETTWGQIKGLYR